MGTIKRPFVSIVIPVYNRAFRIKPVLESVLGQTLQDIEIIVVNDGSTDRTEQEIRTVKDPRVIYLYQGNQGVSAARNKGILEARGEWISFLDSDDFWFPKKLEKQVDLLEKEKNLWCHTEELWIRNGIRVNAHKKHKKPEGRIYLASLPLCVVSPSTVLIHKNIFKEIGIFDPLLPAAEDYDLWLRISGKHEICFCPEPLIEKHGGHADQLSRSFLGLDRFRIRALKKQLGSKNLTHEEMEATREIFARKCRILAQGYKKHGKILISDYYDGLLASL